uniref:Phospholipase A(2) n=1 Tax=Globodera pallida TaxID=36090 RepID=A0A183C6C5_GLOPA
MFSRALILFLLISNLPLIADGGFWGWTTFNPIAELGKRVADLGKKVANTVKEGFDKVVSEIGNDKDWACGPDDPKWLDKPSHIGTELLASMIRACRCCKTKPRKDPCDEPFCKCLEKVGKDSGDVNCLNVLTLFCLTMNVAGDKDGPYHKWIKKLRLAYMPYGYCSCFIGAKDVSMSNANIPADDKLIHLPALNKKSADVAERDSQSKFDKQ